MTKNRRNEHQEFLKEFGLRFIKEVNSNIKFWKSQDIKAAKNRALAFELILNELKHTAQDIGVPLQDIGIEDFKIPRID